MRRPEGEDMGRLTEQKVIYVFATKVIYVFASTALNSVQLRSLR